MIRLVQLSGLLIIFAAGLIAGPPPITVTDAGYFATVLDETGYPSFVPVQVIDLRTDADKPTDPTDPTDPDEPTDPNPPEMEPPPEGVSQESAEWAADVDDPQGAQKYALMLQTVRDGVLEGDVTDKTLFRVLRESADSIVGDDWDSFRRKFGDYLVDLILNQQVTDKNQIADELELVRYGILYSARNGTPISQQQGIAVIATVNAIIDEVSS